MATTRRSLIHPATRVGGGRRARSQRILAAMVSLLFGDMKPGPVRIQIGRNPQRRLEPRVIARCQPGERRLTRPPQLVDIELELVTPNVTAPLSKTFKAADHASFSAPVGSRSSNVTS